MEDHFRLIFSAVLCLTILCGLSATAIALFAPVSPLVDRLFSANIQMFTLGVGAIIALLSFHRSRRK